MAIYHWDEDLIKTTISNERKVHSLLNELYDVKDEELTALFNRNDSFRDFTRNFRLDYVNLARIDEDMREYICFLYEKAKLDEICNVEMPKVDIPDEELVNTVANFFYSLKDKEITSIIEDIVNPNSHQLKIENKTKGGNETSSLVQGRVIKGEDQDTVYGSFYKKGYEEDKVILAHEMGHMLSHRLFGQDINLYMKKFLTEVESYYMELLAGQYLGEECGMFKESLCFRANRLSKIFEQIWDLHIQYVMNTYILNTDHVEISRALQLQGYPREITEEDFKRYIRIPFGFRARMINSYLVALELFRITLEDKEKGIDTYKRLFRSDISKYKKLLNKFDINYLKDSTTLDCMIKENKALQKILLHS